MEYYLTEQQKLVKSLARRIAEERILPVRAELDEKEEFPHEAWKQMGELGLLGACISEEHGGAGGGIIEDIPEHDDVDGGQYGEQAECQSFSREARVFQPG